MEAASDGQATSERQRLLSGEEGREPQYRAVTPGTASDDHGGGAGSTANPEEWRCPQCTLNNPLEVPLCQACGGPRPPEVRARGQDGQPERRRGSLRGREQFQAARQENMRNALLSREAWRSPLQALFFVIGCVLLVIPPIIIIYIEIRSWQVLILNSDKECDQDLVFWLLVRNVMTLTAPRMPAPGDPDAERADRQRRAAHWAATLWVFWLVVGYSWTADCKTCQKTNPELFAWVRFLTVFGLVVHIMNIFFPLLFLLCAMIYHGMVARGWIKSPNAANDNAIETMERVEYNAAEFTGEGPDDPPTECCCCMEEFGPQQPIVRTPCKHYYHYDCLKEWLKLSKTCPLCRGHLDTDPPAPEQV